MEEKGVWKDQKERTGMKSLRSRKSRTSGKEKKDRECYAQQNTIMADGSVTAGMLLVVVE